jgi:hypothetical protein
MAREILDSASSMPMRSQSLSRTVTPSGLEVIPEYESSDPFIPEGSECSQQGDETGRSRVEVERAVGGELCSHPCEFTPDISPREFTPDMRSPRHIFSPVPDSGSCRRSSSGIAGGNRYSSEVDEDGVEGECSNDYLTSGTLTSERQGAGEDGDDGDVDGRPPELTEERTQYSFEDCDSGYVHFEQFRSPRSEMMRNPEWRQDWDFGPESPTDAQDSAELWECHRSKLEELEAALNSIRL